MNYLGNLYNQNRFLYNSGGTIPTDGGAEEVSNAREVVYSDSEPVDPKLARINKIVEEFPKGEMPMEMALYMLREVGIGVYPSVVSNKYCLWFRYQNKTYELACNKLAAQSSRINVQTYDLEELKNKYKFTNDIIYQNFIATSCVNNKALKYIFQPNSKYATIEHLKWEVADKYRNDMILDHFMLNKKI